VLFVSAMDNTLTIDTYDPMPESPPWLDSPLPTMDEAWAVHEGVRHGKQLQRESDAAARLEARS